jgi:hypothetical protein
MHFTDLINDNEKAPDSYKVNLNKSIAEEPNDLKVNMCNPDEISIEIRRKHMKRYNTNTILPESKMQAFMANA